MSLLPGDRTSPPAGDEVRPLDITVCRARRTWSWPRPMFLAEARDICFIYFLHISLTVTHTSLGVKGRLSKVFSKVAVGSRKAESRAKVAVPGGGSDLLAALI